MLDETGALSGTGHSSVELEPMLFVLRSHLAHRLAGRAAQAGLLLEGRVGLDEPVVGHRPGVIEDDLDDAESFLDGIEKRPIARFARSARELSGLDFLGRLISGAIEPGDRALIVA